MSTGNATYFKNSDDFTAATVRKVTHGIAREQPYVVQVNAVHNYTGIDTNGSTEGKYTAETEDEWRACFGDDYLTEWGKDKWYGHKVVDTEFYITVKLADGTEYELTINPPYPGVKNTNYKENLRYAGTDTRIWIRQLRAEYGGDYEDMAKNVSPTDKNFEWWRVNPYWK